MKINESILNKLKLTGEFYSIGDESYLLLIENLQSEENINLITKHFWKRYLDEIPEQDLINIFKGIVLAEKKLGWLGGSVSSGIWIYSIIQERNLDSDYEIADWCLKNSENPYLPFGSHYCGKRTIADYLQYQQLRSENRREKLQIQEKLQERVSKRNQQRKTEIQSLRNYSFTERGEILIELEKKYENASPIEKLNLIANDSKYPPEYYPKSWIQLNNEEINKIPNELALKLIDKLCTKTKGDWRRFRNALIDKFEHDKKEY